MSTRRWTVRLAVAVLAVAATLAGVALLRRPPGERAPGSAAGPSGPNLLLVTIDTLRADRVGAYGYGAGDTPALDGLARRGVLVEDAVVHVAQTRPSHVSLFTGRLPFEHGLRDNFSPRLDPAQATLTTLLKQRGYSTGGFIGAYPVSRDSGLDRGFDVFADPFSGAGGGLRLEQSARPAGAVVDKALAWLQSQPGRPFYAWVHLFDPHAPYEPPPPYLERFAARPYDGEVAYADSQVGRLLGWLDRSGEGARTLVAVLSDHGEGLGDHGEDEHGLLVYDSTLRVPLVLAWPQGLPAGVRVQGQFRGVDLLPTLLDLVGAPAVPTSGASRAAALRAGGRIPDNECYAESLYGQLHFGWAPLRALRAEGWKYVAAPRAELYDLRDDPGELRNRLGERERLASAMGARLSGYDSKAPAASSAGVEPGAAERLAALGYVGGAFFSGTPSGRDPKDALGEYQAFHRRTAEAVRLFEARDYAGAVRLLRPLAARRPGGGDQQLSFSVSFYLGRALLELGRFGEASDQLEVARRLSPMTASLYALLARAQAGAGRIEDAMATAARGLEVGPGDPGLLRVHARLLAGRGAEGPALAALHDARRQSPSDPYLRLDLANLLRASRPAEALAEAEEAARLDPRLPEAQVARGLCLGALGRDAEAEAAFRAALELAPADPDALFFAAALELRAGRAADARARLERLLAMAPGYPQARDLLAQARQPARPEAAGKVHLRLLRVSGRARAEEALRRVRSGEDFASLARELSRDASAPRGGDLGLLRVADLAEPLRSAAGALAPGAVSLPIETSDGYVLVKRER